MGARGAVRRAHGARLLLPQPVPLRLERPRADARAAAATRSPARSCAALFRRWRQWDWIAAQRTDRYVANSRTTQARIRTYFGRESEVVYPPVDTGALPARAGRRRTTRRLGADAAQADRGRDRRVQPAAAAADRRRRRTRLPGGCAELAGPTVQFAGRLPDAAVAEVLQGARALIVTAVEEFGIAAVESQAAGRPVIARRAGGALETVVDGVTGCFWSGGPEELAEAVRDFDDAAVDPRGCTRNAARFDAAGLPPGMLAEVEAACAIGAARRRERQPLASTRLCGAPRGTPTAELGRDRAGVLTAARLVLLAGPTVLAFFSGGYFDAPRAWAGLAAWLLVAVALATLPWPPRLGRPFCPSPPAGWSCSGRGACCRSRGRRAAATRTTPRSWCLCMWGRWRRRRCCSARARSGAGSSRRWPPDGRSPSTAT